MGLGLDFLLIALINPIWALFGFLSSPVDQQTLLPGGETFGVGEARTINVLAGGHKFTVALPKYNGLGVNNVKRKFGDDFLDYFQKTGDNDNSVVYTMTYDPALCNGGAITVGMKFENTVSGEYVTPEHTHFTVQERIEVPARWFLDNGCKSSD